MLTNLLQVDPCERNYTFQERTVDKNYVLRKLDKPADECAVRCNQNPDCMGYEATTNDDNYFTKCLLMKANYPTIKDFSGYYHCKKGVTIFICDFF